MEKAETRIHAALERRDGESELDEAFSLERGWKTMIAEVRASATPYRFTFEGQTMPWMDPIPSPDDDPNAPYDGPMGLCPHAMLRRVRTVRKIRGVPLRWSFSLATPAVSPPSAVPTGTRG